MNRLSLFFFLSICSLVGCKPETTIDDVACPPDGTALRYESFARGFFGEHCQTCHGRPTSDRRGAPSTYDFGTLDAVRHHRARIFARAAADNTTMPPGPDDPPRVDRDRLAEWLACGAPE